MAGIRRYELNDATSGTPAFTQQSTYQPNAAWRWMGSAAMDQSGNLAIGYSASSASISPQIRYAGRLASDPANTLAQGEATSFTGTGSPDRHQQSLGRLQRRVRGRERSRARRPGSTAGRRVSRPTTTARP